jgi:outer membrane protein OmpA-like peptidoglycan-associated protein
MKSQLFRLLTALLCLGVIAEAHAQFGDRLLDRARRAAEREVGQSVERGVGDVVGCVVGNDDCDDDSAAATPAPGVGAAAVNVDGVGAVGEAPGEGIWRNYDFTPGKRVKYASDWERARVGRIPQDIRFISGNMQLVELDGERVLEISNNAVFQVLLDETLPESFSVEYEAKASRPNVPISTYFESFTEPGTAYQTYPYNYLMLRGVSGIQSNRGFVSSLNTNEASREIVPVKFQYDFGYAVMYVGSDRVAQSPNVNFPQGSVIEFVVGANASYPAYIKNIVVAYDVDDPYGALMDQGQFTTRGILFDVDQARLRPESTPVLLQLIEMLEDHEDLARVIIEGHTDSSGDDAYNVTLSQQRAEAVRSYFVANGIAADRIEANGLGESQPVADNASEAGRQENRRVVVRLP